jgi:hypothetical protein
MARNEENKSLSLSLENGSESEEHVGMEDHGRSEDEKAEDAAPAGADDDYEERSHGEQEGRDSEGEGSTQGDDHDEDSDEDTDNEEEEGSDDDDDEGSDELSEPPVFKIDSLDEFEKVLSNLKSKRDEKDAFNDFITEEDYAKQFIDENYVNLIHFDIEVPEGESVKARFLDLLIETAAAFLDIPRVYAIDFLFDESEFRFLGERKSLPPGSSIFGRDTSISLLWKCELPIEDYELIRIQSSLKSMEYLNISNDSTSRPHVQFFPSFKSQATELYMSGPFELTPENFPCLKHLHINDTNKHISVANDKLISNLRLLSGIKKIGINWSKPLCPKLAASISSLPVSELGVTNCHISEDTLLSLLSQCRGNRSIQSMSLDCSIFTTGNYEALSKFMSVLLKQLRRLDLSSTSFGKNLSREDGENLGKLILNGIQKSQTITEFKFTPISGPAYTEATAAALEIAGHDALETWRGSDGSTIDHILKLNKAGRRIISEMEIIHPSLVPHILSNANMAYDATGIFYLLREHPDLRSKVIASLAKGTHNTNTTDDAKLEGLRKRQRR